MRKVILVILLTAGVLLPLGAQDPAYNRPPLMPSEFGELPLGAIRPQGRLLQQLEAQRDGLTGRLDEVYPAVVGERNAWLGGDGDAWERGPYWIDGLLPLGYILQDNQLIAKAGRWVEAILSSGQENGFFGPSEDRSFERGMQRDNARDWWPRMVALKILNGPIGQEGDGRAAAEGEAKRERILAGDGAGDDFVGRGIRVPVCIGGIAVNRSRIADTRTQEGQRLVETAAGLVGRGAQVASAQCIYPGCISFIQLIFRQSVSLGAAPGQFLLVQRRKHLQCHCFSTKIISSTVS